MTLPRNARAGLLALLLAPASLTLAPGCGDSPADKKTGASRRPRSRSRPARTPIERPRNS